MNKPVTKAHIHYISIKIAKKKNQKSDSPKCWQGCREMASLIYCWWEFNIVHPCWKTFSYKTFYWHFLIKLSFNYCTTWKLHPWTFVPEKWKLTSMQKPIKSVHSSLIHNSQKLKSSVGKWLNCHVSWNTMQRYEGQDYWCMRWPEWSPGNYVKQTKSTPKG